MYLHLGSDFVIKILILSLFLISETRKTMYLKIICKSSAKNINTRL